MRSKHRPDLPHHIPPLLDQGGYLLGFPRMGMGDVDQDPELGIHHAQIGIEFHAGVDHAHIDGQGLTGLDDALIGFFGGHAIMCSNGTSAVNGGAS
jgi:hypothetical protein